MHLTVGDLRKLLANLPDDMIVMLPMKQTAAIDVPLRAAQVRITRVVIDSRSRAPVYVMATDIKKKSDTDRESETKRCLFLGG